MRFLCTHSCANIRLEWMLLTLQNEASRAQAAQKSSNDMKEHIDALKDEVSRLNATVADNATFSQELTVCPSFSSAVK